MCLFQNAQSVGPTKGANVTFMPPSLINSTLLDLILTSSEPVCRTTQQITYTRPLERSGMRGRDTISTVMPYLCKLLFHQTTLVARTIKM